MTPDGGHAFRAWQGGLQDTGPSPERRSAASGDAAGRHATQT